MYFNETKSKYVQYMDINKYLVKWLQCIALVMIHIIIQHCSRWMIHMCTLQTVFIIEPDRCSKEGPAESLLHTAGVDQSGTGAALQSRQEVLQGLWLTVQHWCQFSQDPSVAHLPHWIQRTELDFLMTLSSPVRSHSRSLTAMLLLQQTPLYRMADATTES